MSDGRSAKLGDREQLVQLDAQLGRAWAKAEIFLGLTASGAGLFLGTWHLAKLQGTVDGWMIALALGLFVCGGCLALAGHRSHLYRWNNRNAVLLIDELRRSHAGRDKPS